MGQSQIQLKQTQDYRLIQQLPVGNIVKHNKTQSLHFLKQYSFTSQQAYQNALNMYSLKLANKNQHILNFMHFTTKSQNSFCSSFHKIILIFQYADYTLEKQLANRIRDGHPFNQKEIWSILCSCVLAAVHLVHTEGRMHCGLSAKDIKLNHNGCIKLLSHQMVGIDPNHNQNQGIPKNLAITLIQCINMKKITNQDQKYLQNLIQSIQCSNQMKQMLQIMIKNNITFLQLQEYLFKLVQDDQSIASHSNTPILKNNNTNYSPYKCPRIIPNDNKSKNYNKSQIKETKIQPIQADSEDTKSYIFIHEQADLQIQTPDETQQSIQQNAQESSSSPDYINEFYLNKQSKKQTNSKSKQLKFQELNKIQAVFAKAQYQININPTKSSRRKQNSQFIHDHQKNKNSVTSQLTTNMQNEANLFTDPKLFSLIKSDLEEIKMRRSMGQLGFQRMSETNRSENLNISNKGQDKSMEIGKIVPESSWFRDNQGGVQNNIHNNSLKQIEIIKQVSQEYRQEQQQAKSRVNVKQIPKQENKKQELSQTEKLKADKIKKQQTLIQKNQNIMNDPAIGFKKKKQQTATFQIPKQNVLHQTLRNQNPPKTSQKQSVYPIKIQPKFSPKSKTISMKPVGAERNINLIRKQQFFNEYAYSDSSQPFSSQTSPRVTTNRNQKAQKDTNKLVHVNEQYNRGNYEGTKLNGKRHGLGTFFYSQGGKYIGNWRQNKMHGKGILYYPSQKIAYDGQWQNDQLSGYGILYNEQVKALRAPFDYRDWTDAEDYWVKYQGQFHQDNKEGRGKLFLVNGQRLQAQFHDDKVDGEGLLYFVDGNKIMGVWKQNKLVKCYEK